MPTNRELRLELEAKTGLSIPPGTEILDDEYEGVSRGKQVLLPVPANDPADPLNWSTGWKVSAYSLCLVYVFLQCYPALVISLFYAPMGSEFNVDSSKLAYLTGSMILLLGLGNLLFIPIASAHGRRTSMTIANVLCSASFIWQARATSYGSLMGGRVLNGLGACLIETIGPMVIEDLFFVHERGRMNGIYFGTLFAATGFGPFIASLFAQYSNWRNFFWCTFATSMVCQIALAFFPETKYHRTPIATPAEASIDAVSLKAEETAYVASATCLGTGRPPRSAFTFWTRKVEEDSYLWEFSTPLLLTQFPLALWPSFMFAMAAICPLFISIIQAILYGAPPYNFSMVAVGATNWTTVVGNLLGALLAGWMSDFYVAWRTKRNGNVREPEFRLPVLVPFALALVLGLASLGISADKHDPWAVSVIVSLGLAAIGTTGVATVALSFGVDCYPRYAGQLLTLATIVKNVLAFGLSYGIVDWVLAWGWARSMGTWAGLTALVALAATPLYVWGKALRVRSATSAMMKDE
ncbi:hypothetical protein JCM3770_002868 [Rhodotorula araucariae]